MHTEKLRNGCLLLASLVFFLSSCAFAKEKDEKYEKMKTLEGGYVIDPKPLPFDEKTVKELQRRGYSMLLLTTTDGVAVFSITGKPVAPDCQLENGKIPEKCGLSNISLKSLMSVSIGTYHKNPQCKLGVVGRYMARVHAGGDGYASGMFPCHDGSH